MTAVITGATAPQQAAPVTTPAPAPVHYDDLPIMREPPPSYAPPVKAEGTNRSQRITPIRQLRKEEGPEPDWVKCPLCNKVTTIRRVSEPSDEAKCLTVCCCFTGLLLFLSPGAGDLFEKVDVHCCSCERHIASIPPDGQVEIVRVSNRPPLPTAK